LNFHYQEQIFTTWFKNTFISEINNDEVIIGVPNAFTKTWLENKYHGQIVKALQNTSKEPNKEGYL